MLKGIPPVISPDLLKILAEMGHGDELVIADAHFPSHTLGQLVTRADAITSTNLLKAILKLMLYLSVKYCIPIFRSHTSWVIVML